MISDLIGFDSTVITITRHTKVDADIGYTLTDTILDPITVRLYQIATHNQSEYTIPEGKVMMITHGILAEPTVDIVVSHNSFDTFVDNGRTYRIVGVRHYDDVNIDEHIQADCVAV